MIKLLSTTLLLAFLAMAHNASAQVTKLVPLTTFGTNGDGTIRSTNDVDWLNNAGEIQRGMAWNPVTGHLLVVCRTNAFSPTRYRVIIVDGTTGIALTNELGEAKSLDLSSLVEGTGNGSFLLNCIGVADDGAIYGANLSNVQNPAEMVIYRWENEDAVMQFPPYFGDPSNGTGGTINRRWGDTFAVRGSGINTEVLLASRGTNVAIFKPTDGTMSSFYATTLHTDAPVGGLGFGLCFGAGNTFWGTSGANGGGPLLQMSYDLGAGTATTLHSYTAASGAFPATVSPIAVLTASNLLAGIDTRAGADMTRLYDITDLANPPVQTDRQTWYTNFNNNIFAGALAFTTNGLLYALDSDNGITAYYLTNDVATPLSPTIILQPATRLVQVNSNVLFTAASDGTAPLAYQWFYNVTNAIANATNTSYTATNAQILNSGSYTFVASNAYGFATSSIATLTVISNSLDFLVYDNFGYTVGSQLAGQSPPGWAFLWTNNNSSASGSISNFNLRVAGLAPSQGNAYVWNNSASSMRLPIGVNVNGTLYFSFIYRMDVFGTPPAPASETMAGFTFGGGTSFGSKINVTTNGAAPGAYRLGLFKGGGTSNGSIVPVDFNVGDVLFIVGRYTFNIAGNTDDTCDLWINPDPSTFGTTNPPPPIIANAGAGGTDLSSLDRFFFRRSNGWPARTCADELRLGYAWAQVTPPAPPSLAVTTSGTNAIVSWWTNYFDFSLQSATNLTSAPWVNVANPPVVSGTNYDVTVPSTNSARFFRLIK